MSTRLALLAMAAGLALAQAACTHDVVYPDLPEPVCGNGVLESGEQCDVSSAGCVGCSTVPTWTCQTPSARGEPAGSCQQICGDGVTGDGATCANPRRDTACDMTGYWAVRTTDHTRDNVVGDLQTSSNWNFYRLSQTGTDFQVVQSLDCGVHVTGSVTVDYTPGSLQGMIYLNREDAESIHGARHGTSAATTGGCAVTFDRWYSIRGAEESYLPQDFGSLVPLTQLPALPAVADPVNGDAVPAGATDPDGDGLPGVAFEITGIVQGVRDSVQRLWKEYASAPGAPMASAAITFTAPGTYDLQESIMRLTQCGDACSLLNTLANPTDSAPVTVTFWFLGKTLGSPRVSAVVAGQPLQNLQDDLTTCANVRRVLPHDPS